MRQVFSGTLAVMLILSLAACAGKKDNNVRVKCPACGYEFEAPVE